MPRYSRPVPGDGLLALSGAQSAGKPDPENAVRVALGAQAAVQAEKHSPRYEQGGTVVAKARTSSGGSCGGPPSFMLEFAVCQMCAACVLEPGEGIGSREGDP